MDLATEKARAFPLTSENVQKDPTVLTRYAVPRNEAERRPFDGKVGNVNENDLLTFSPNVDYLFAPPHLCRVRLRRDYHFGFDDPLYFPQPFIIESGHLALMRCPSRNPMDDFYYAWLTPLPNQFIVMNSPLGLGKLDPEFHKALSALSYQVLKGVPAYVDNMYLSSLGTNLRRFLDRLDIPWTMVKMFVLVAQIQCYLLELDARSRWVRVEWRQRLKDAAKHIRQPLVQVIGAFTEDLGDLDLLFYAGIPVWYICTVKSMPFVRIDSVVSFIREDYSQRLTQPDGFVVDATDATPPHKIIYDGLPNKPDHYRNMAKYLDSLLSETPMLSGPRPKRTELSLRRKGDLKFTPYTKGSPKLAPISNTFLVPDSIFMPTLLPNWSSALRILSEHNQALRPPPGVKSGYRVPPVRNIISPTKAQTVRLLFHGWLRIRKIILTQLNGLPLCLTSKQWRCLLEIAGWRHGDADAPTLTGQCQSEMRLLLNWLYNLRQSSAENISLQPVSWNGHPLPIDNDLSVQIGQEIIWELQEYGFRSDLVALDQRLDESNMDAAQRRSLLNGCWEETASHVDIRMSSKGLGAATVKDRWVYLRALHRVMQSWKGEKPELLLLNLPHKDEGGDFGAFITRLEYALANFYTNSFLQVFGRAACIPYQL